MIGETNMSMMDKFLNVINLNNGDDDYYDSDDEAYYSEDEGGSLHKTPIGKDDLSIEVPEDKLKKTPIKQMPTSSKSSKKTVVNTNTAGMEVCVLKPTSIEEAKEVTETLLSNRTVVLNLEGIDVDVAQRIIDFSVGSCYAISGNFQKISKYIFIITPSIVDISGDFQNMLTGSVDDTHHFN